MKRGLTIAVACLAAGAALVACKKSGGAKKRVPGGEAASAAALIRTIEAVGGVDGTDGLILLAEGVSEVCGKGCACLATTAKSDDVDRAKHLYECPSLCSGDARAKAAAAAPGQRFSTLSGACTPEGLGLTADTAKKVGDDWIAAFVSGQYLADAYDAANPDDKKAYDTALKDFSVPLAPTPGMAGVALAGATKVEALGRSRSFVAIDAKGALTMGTMHGARFTPAGAVYVPVTTKAVADVAELDKQLRAAKYGITDDVVAKDDALQPPPADDDPPPPPEPVDDEDESGGTGTAMALDEGKMGKKDTDRTPGAYKMDTNDDGAQLAREQAIEQARSAGILGSDQLAEGGAFAVLTGTGDTSSGFDDPDFDRGAPEYSVVGVTSTPIRDQLIVIADKDAPAMTLLAVLSAVPDGAVLAVEHDGRLAAIPFVFSQGAFGRGRMPEAEGAPVDVRISIAPDAFAINSSVDQDLIEVKSGDGAGLVAAIKKLLDDPAFADRRDVKVLVQQETKVGQLVPVLDGALGAGARTARLESPVQDTGWGTIGTGRYGTIGHGSGTGAGYGVGEGPGGARSADLPSIAIGQPSAAGDLDKAIIRRYIKRNIMKLSYCYEKQLLVNPKLEGTVTAQFFIAPSGMVATANATGVDPEVSSCVAAVIKGIEFPKPKGGGGVQVNYPFIFKPTGG